MKKNLNWCHFFLIYSEFMNFSYTLKRINKSRLFLYYFVSTDLFIIIFFWWQTHREKEREKEGGYHLKRISYSIHHKKIRIQMQIKLTHLMEFYQQNHVHHCDFSFVCLLIFCTEKLVYYYFFFLLSYVVQLFSESSSSSMW